MTSTTLRTTDSIFARLPEVFMETPAIARQGNAASRTFTRAAVNAMGYAASGVGNALAFCLASPLLVVVALMYLAKGFHELCGLKSH